MNSEIIDKNKYILIAIGLILVIAGGILSYKKVTPPVASISPIPSQSSIISSTPFSTPTPPPEVWETYTNTQLGFSIKYPQMVYGLNNCIDPEKTEKDFYVPVKTFEDNKNDMAFITAEYYYKAETQWDPVNFTTQIGPCKKNVSSLETLQDEIKKQQEENRKFFSYPIGPAWSITSVGWVILIKDAKNENELNKFIKDNYGSGCFVENKKLWKQEGVYEIEIKGEDWNKGGEPENSTCRLPMTALATLYKPKTGKIMSVNLGQGCTFAIRKTDGKDYQCYDNTIIDSFRFK